MLGLRWVGERQRCTPWDDVHLFSAWGRLKGPYQYWHQRCRIIPVPGYSKLIRFIQDQVKVFPASHWSSFLFQTVSFIQLIPPWPNFPFQRFLVFQRHLPTYLHRPGCNETSYCIILATGFAFQASYLPWPVWLKTCGTVLIECKKNISSID